MVSRQWQRQEIFMATRIVFLWSATSLTKTNFFFLQPADSFSFGNYQPKPPPIKPSPSLFEQHSYNKNPDSNLDSIDRSSYELRPHESSELPFFAKKVSIDHLRNGNWNNENNSNDSSGDDYGNDADVDELLEMTRSIMESQRQDHLQLLQKAQEKYSSEISQLKDMVVDLQRTFAEQAERERIELEYSAAMEKESAVQEVVDTYENLISELQEELESLQASTTDQLIQMQLDTSNMISIVEERHDAEIATLKSMLNDLQDDLLDQFALERQELERIAREDKERAVQEIQAKYDVEIASLKEIIETLRQQQDEPQFVDDAFEAVRLTRQLDATIMLETQERHREEIASIKRMVDELVVTYIKQIIHHRESVEEKARLDKEEAIRLTEQKYQREIEVLKKTIEDLRSSHAAQLKAELKQAKEKAEADKQRAIAELSRKHQQQIIALKSQVDELQSIKAEQSAYESERIIQEAQAAKEKELQEIVAKYEGEINKLRAELEDARADSMVFQSTLPNVNKIMADAQSDKARAVQEVEQRYRRMIRGLQQKIQLLESGNNAKSADAPWERDNAADLSYYQDRIKAYQKLLSDLAVKSKREKEEAVAETEKRLQNRYESIIRELKQERIKEEQYAAFR